MKKILFFAVLLFAFSAKLSAQTSTSSTADGGKFSIGVNPGLLVGNAHDAYSFALGGDLKYAYPIASNVSLSLSAGFTELFGKTVNYSFTDGETSVSGSVKAPNVNAIPVKLGFRYTANGSTGFFGEAQFGAAFLNQGGGTAFAYAPAIGYAFNGGFEAGVRYEGWSKDGTISQVALRIAYSF